MKNFKRIQALLLVAIMAISMMGTTAFAAEKSEHYNDVIETSNMGEITQEKLPDGRTANTISFTVDGSTNDGIIEIPSAGTNAAPRMWDQGTVSNMTNDIHFGTLKTFSDGNRLGYDIEVTPTNGVAWSRNQTVTVRLVDEDYNDISESGGYACTNSSDYKKGDHIPIVAGKKYRFKYLLDRPSLSHPVDIKLTWYTWTE